MDTEARYTIGAVAQRTQLSPHVIRAWERRYGVVTPSRSEGGTRLYSNADVLRLRLLRRATESGYPIGRARELNLEELVALTATEEVEDESAGAAPACRLSRIHAVTLAAIEAMDAAGVKAELRRASALLGARPFVDRVAFPLLRRIGELWQDSTFCPAQEHILSVGLQRELTHLLEALQGSREAPSLVAATFAGEHHELGALAAGVIAATEGWRVTYPGSNLPPEDIALAARLTGAKTVLISSILPAESVSVPEQGRKLMAALPDGTMAIIGGPAAAEHAQALTRAGATYLPDLTKLAEEIAQPVQRSSASRFDAEILA